MKLLSTNNNAEKPVIVPVYTQLKGIRKLVQLIADIRTGGPTAEDLASGWRPLRLFETKPDGYTSFTQAQRLWVIETSFPRLFAFYRWMASIRCMLHGAHEFAAWEGEKYTSSNASYRHCKFCGRREKREIVYAPNEIGTTERITVVEL